LKNPRKFLFALLVAFIATLSQCRYVAKREKQLLYQSEPLPTVMALKNIPADFKLDETMVQLVDVPREWRQPKALSSVEDIIGQISKVPIIEGEQVVLTKLVRPKEAGLAYFVPKGKRGVAMAVDDVTGVGGHLRPGNSVDIMGTFDFGEGEKADMRTVTLFQNVFVLAVARDTGQPTADSIRTSDELAAAAKDTLGLERELARERARQGGRTISLALSPEQAQKIVLAQELGTLSVALRSLWEADRTVELAQATINTTLGIAQKVRRPRRAPYRVITSGGF